MINVIGHLNPDSDAICTAVVTAWWLNDQQRPATAWRAGAANRETTFIFQQAGLTLPNALTTSLTNLPVWLVDFTEPTQGPATLAKSQIIGVIDHHRLGGLSTLTPPEVWISPVGSSATLLWQLMSESCRKRLPTSLAILLLGAILSDTVVLRSPTTTHQDSQAVDDLFSLTGLDRTRFPEQLLVAKTDIVGLSADQLIHKDLKRFSINNTDIQIAQLEFSHSDQIEPLLDELISGLRQLLEQSHAGACVLMLTDITRDISTLYFAGPALAHTGPCSVPGMLSRKKQLLPWLQAQLEDDGGTK